MNEDVFPIEDGDFPASHVSYSGVQMIIDKYKWSCISWVYFYRLELIGPLGCQIFTLVFLMWTWPIFKKAWRGMELVNCGPFSEIFHNKCSDEINKKGEMLYPPWN